MPCRASRAEAVGGIAGVERPRSANQPTRDAAITAAATRLPITTCRRAAGGAGCRGRFAVLAVTSSPQNRLLHRQRRSCRERTPDRVPTASARRGLFPGTARPDGERDGHIGQRPKIARLGAQRGVQPVDRRLALERGRAREHLVEHAAEREDVGTVIGRLAPNLLGGHVAGRSHDRARAGLRSRSSPASRSAAPGAARFEASPKSRTLT